MDDLELIRIILESCWDRWPDGTRHWSPRAPLRVEAALSLIRSTRESE